MTNAEEHSTHAMVENIHRRMDGWDEWRDKIADRVLVIERGQAEADKVLALLQQKVTDDRETNNRMYSEFKSSLDGLGNKLDARNKRDEELRTQDSRDKQRILWGLIIASFSALSTLAVLLYGRLG